MQFSFHSFSPARTLLIADLSRHPGKSVKKIAIIGSVADSGSYDPAGATQGLGMSWFSGDYYSGQVFSNVVQNLSKFNRYGKSTIQRYRYTLFKIVQSLYVYIYIYTCTVWI